MSSPSFLEAAIPHFQPPLEEVLFIGGAVVPLYITDPAALCLRPTLGIDILPAATTYSAYKSIVEKLLSIGCSHDLRGPIRRFFKSGLIAGLLSPDKTVPGFSNRWYREALAHPHAASHACHQTGRVRIPRQRPRRHRHTDRRPHRTCPGIRPFPSGTSQLAFKRTHRAGNSHNRPPYPPRPLPWSQFGSPPRPIPPARVDNRQFLTIESTSNGVKFD